MYRSDEIIQLFYDLNLPKEITKYILILERQNLFNKSLNEWIYFSNKAKKNKFERLFCDINNDYFLNEIKKIRGDFKILKDHLINIHNNNIQNQIDKRYLNSIRY